MSLHGQDARVTLHPRAMVNTAVLDLIGHTPLIELSPIHRGPGRILAKCEFLNPGGSMKDRAALRIIRDAESSGRLAPAQTVVEMTSGNMGAGLAVVCRSEEHTSELQSPCNLVCRLLIEKKKT